jgi:hypothetical protein
MNSWICGWWHLLLLLYTCRTRLVAPPHPTHVEESSDDSPSDSSGYNDECPHVKEVSSYEHYF